MNSQLIYHILIDRFFPSGSEDKNGNFKGGTIRGIISHLDYIRELGMTGIMLTPFSHSAAYHGYHTVDLDEVDPHFGTWDDVGRLVAEVHSRRMTIVADFVANHCHSDSPIYKDGNHRDWFRRDTKGKVMTFAGIDCLPMFDTDNPQVRRYLTDKALRLCSAGFDAIRLDHATGPTYGFWKYLRREIKRRYPDVVLIGEVWGAMDFRPRYRLRYAVNRLLYGAQEARQLEYVNVLDGLLDFRYHELIIDAIHKKESLTKKGRLYGKIKRHFKRYPADFGLWLFLDNHDLNRIFFECGFDETAMDNAIAFTEQWDKTVLWFYGTEKRLANTKSIFDGTPYADERVRMSLTNN
ncbi:MAG: hypothetical protein K2N28_07720 [Muribaculaceae bacterium]|nr:hypothetical protein [Muribaculaceae bacterium]